MAVVAAAAGCMLNDCELRAAAVATLDRCQGSLQVCHQHWDHLTHSRCCDLRCKHFRSRVCRLLRTV